jgi:DNA invertase Pin-like site-specific DNA recombinase
MKKAVIYARYSPGGQQTAQSIEGQLKVCREYATREGFHIMGEYADQKLTGKTAEKRLDFQRMIADSARGRWEYVIVYQLDRFSRNKYDNAIYKEKLSRHGVKVISAMEQINTEDASGILMETMLEGMAAYYSAELSQKIQRGRAVNASKFLSLGSNPGLGFKVVDRQITVDEATAVHIIRIFEMYANGATMREIIDCMNDIGVKTSHNKPFNRNSLTHILRNKRYCTIYSYKGADTPDALPRIVPQHLFDQVQLRLTDNIGAGGRGKAVEDFILSGKLFCGHCLVQMIGTSGTSKTGKLYSYYKEKGKGCRNLTVTKRKIEDKVIAVVRDMLTEENQRIIAGEISALCENESDNPNLKRLQRLIKDNNKQKSNLLQSLKVGEASAAAANYVFSEIDKLEKEVAELENQAAIEEDRYYGLSEIDIMYFLHHLKNGSKNLDDTETRKLLVNTMVNSIYLFENGDLTITFNVSNQEPVKVDISLLDEIQEHKGDKGSYTSLLLPPNRLVNEPLSRGFVFLRGLILSQ